MTDPTYKTIEELRAFLRICLAPGHGVEPRTVETLANLMRPWLVDDIAAHAPHLGQLRTAADDARTAYLTALGAWIADETAAATAGSEPL
ncbi:hypothetical protein [Streptomyces sp. NPDC052179]|uniref:hypothetical protein n=1 Tax=Streptomyces sp. NPDC052179 TaxID=3155680 RepID=UPI0034303358